MQRQCPIRENPGNPGSRVRPYSPDIVRSQGTDCGQPVLVARVHLKGTRGRHLGPAISVKMGRIGVVPKGVV